MNKAVPWNISGVGFDAREAARESARRQGKSLGEWLHGVIADHAAERGVAAHDVVDQDRIDAVTAKLERLSGRAAEFDRRPRRDRPDDGLRARTPRADLARDADDDMPIRRSAMRRDPDVALEQRRVRRSPMIEETEFLLEEAIDAMERRAMRSQRRTDDALASLAQLLETNEIKRELERDAVRDLGEKLSGIEAKLTMRKEVADETPISNALARLEARLETIGRRTAAETTAHDNASRSVSENSVDNEPIRRLEDKLSSILDAVAQRPREASPSVEASPIHRRLGEAITEISRRQQSLDGPQARVDGGRAPASSGPLVVRDIDDHAPWRRSLVDMQSEIAELATKIEGMRHDVVHRRDAASSGDIDVGGLRAEIGSLSQSLRELAPREMMTKMQVSIEALSRRLEASREHEAREASLAAARAVDPTSPVAIDKIEGRLDSLARKLEDAIKAAPGPQADVAGLKQLVRDLSQKIEVAQAPGADRKSVEALQRQIELLATRFARSEDGLESLSSLKNSMKDLFAHLEATRAKVEASAADAARAALRTAIDQGNGQPSVKDTQDIEALKALQRDADARTQTTLNAVHETLELVVGRMSAMETELARRPPPAPVAESSRSQASPVSEPAPTKSTPVRSTSGKPTPAKPAPDFTLGSIDPLREPLFAQRSADIVRAPTATKRPKPPALDEEAGRADFIAAARRAAQIAQSDPAIGASPRADEGSNIRAGLMAKSREYVATHKRPVLLSIAAVFVVLGTMAIVQRMTFDSDDSSIAAMAPAKIVQMADTAGPSAPTASDSSVAATAADLSPSALPKGAHALSAQIPGSDPIQTGSIQSLPAFAAQGLGSQPPRPSLSAGLTTMAQAGDGAAEYELASRYADGKAVPRDFTLAAKWYAKAADQGVAPAQYHLAALYEKGLGVAKDKDKAKSLYEQAANAGNPRAMHNLAVLLADGNGKPDYAGAAAWFRKAAQYGVHDSQYNLAILLARGLGVNQSLVQSYQWFAVAAAQNDPDAAKKRDEVGDKLNANDLAVAKALAASFQPRTANVAATDVAPPPGGWDGVGGSSQINNARSKISSL